MRLGMDMFVHLRYVCILWAVYLNGHNIGLVFNFTFRF